MDSIPSLFSQITSHSFDWLVLHFLNLSDHQNLLKIICTPSKIISIYKIKLWQNSTSNSHFFTCFGMFWFNRNSKMMTPKTKSANLLQTNLCWSENTWQIHKNLRKFLSFSLIINNLRKCLFCVWKEGNYKYLKSK